MGVGEMSVVVAMSEMMLIDGCVECDAALRIRQVD